jgi:hypothetical protein
MSLLTELLMRTGNNQLPAKCFIGVVKVVLQLDDCLIKVVQLSVAPDKHSIL